jgi:hypothetical protein
VSLLADSSRWAFFCGVIRAASHLCGAATVDEQEKTEVTEASTEGSSCEPFGFDFGGKTGIFGGVLLVCAVYEEFYRSLLVLAAEIENLGCVAIVWAEGSLGSATRTLVFRCP